MPSLLPRIRVLLDYPRPEIKTPGFGMTRVAGAFKFAALKREFKYTGSLVVVTGRNRYTPADIDPKAWQEPSTGIVMLRPRALYANFMEDAGAQPDRYDVSEFDHGSSDGGGALFIQLPNRRALVLRRENKDSDFVELTVPANVAASLTQTGGANGLGWASKTKTYLARNEGFGFLIVPHGTAEDRSADYKVFTWDRFSVRVQMNGIALFAVNMGSTVDPEWVVKSAFNFGNAGINHTRPFTIYILPFGRKFIGVYFGQGGMPGYEPVRSASAAKRSAFLFDIEKAGLPTPEFDNSMKHYVKTEAGNLYVAIQKKKHHYQWQPFKLRYPFDATITLMPEQLGITRPYDPVFTAYGYQPTGTTLAPMSNVNAFGDAFDKLTDIEVVPRFTMTHIASGPYQNLYTPELWYFDLEVETEGWNPPYVEDDISHLWTELRIQRGVDPDLFEGHIKANYEDHHFQLYRRGTPFLIEIDGKPAMQGYAKRPHHTIGGTTSKYPVGQLMVDTEFEIKNEWYRFETTPIMESIAIDGKTIKEVVSKLIKRTGYTDADIIFDPEIENLKLEGFTENNEVKTFNEDTMIADVFREIIKKFGFQGRSYMRIVKGDDAKWHIGFAPEFIEGITADPRVFFYLDTSLAPMNIAEQERWKTTVLNEEGEEEPQDAHFIITSRPECISNAGEWNAAKFTTATGAESSADGLQIIIPPNPKVFDDPGSYLFEGLVRAGVIGPPEITATDEKSLTRQGRMMYDQAQRDQLVFTFDAEWQPAIKEDLHFIIVGRDRNGDPCSYGVFRIETVDVTIRRDITPGSAVDESSWSWTANYTVIYVARSASDDFPMVFPSQLTPPKHYAT